MRARDTALLCAVLATIAVSLVQGATRLPQPAPPATAVMEPRDIPYVGAIELVVDASNTAQNIVKVHETVPVAGSGDFVLLYPEWRPGTHSPTGRSRLSHMAGLKIVANGELLPWSRDPVNMYAFHVPVPLRTASLEIDFQYLAPPSTDYGLAEMTTNILTLDWDAVVLYPAGYYARQIPIRARLKIPQGWRMATALENDGDRAVSEGIPRGDDPGAQVRFRPTTLESLIDSPVYAGSYFSRLNLAPGAGVPVYLNLFGDRPEVLVMTPEQLAAHRALIGQAYALFGSHHYDHYDFLVTVSDTFRPGGLEHHRSSADGVLGNYLRDWDKSAILHSLLGHEFVHSWNGKFRRPADLWTPNYNEPMRDSLLWVYEGQTEYWGQVLSTRAGLWSSQQGLDNFALIAARYHAEPGRDWRSLQDTTNQSILSVNQTPAWNSWQRDKDFYDVGALIWLDADTLIRERSHGSHSLDDFARQFFGVDDGSFGELTYTFADVVAALNRVLPYDWANFLRQRLDAVHTEPPLAGIARGGYRLVFTDTASDLYRSSEARQKLTVLTYSIGLSVDKDGKLKDVLWNGPAFKAGLAPATQIIAVNGVAFDVDKLKEAIGATRDSSDALTLIVREGDQFRSVQLDYHGGLRYPHLERDPSRPALLDEILTAKKVE